MTSLRGVRRAVAAAAALLAATAQAEGRTDAGAAIFAAHCARCHGVNADGVSRMSLVLVTKPPSLRGSRLSRAEQERMVRLGGEGNGRSALMPAWSDTLDAAQIGAVLDYLQALRRPHGGLP
jgi:mono/diheme cytochrome c family protein